VKYDSIQIAQARVGLLVFSIQVTAQEVKLLWTESDGRPGGLKIQAWLLRLRAPRQDRIRKEGLDLQLRSAKLSRHDFTLDL
jgi:hypothetical protein